MKLRLPNVWFGFGGAIVVVGGAVFVLLTLTGVTIAACTSSSLAACLGWGIGLVGWIIFMVIGGVLALSDLSIIQ